MLSFRDGRNRRHTLLAGLDTWMSFDAADRGDLYCDGFRSLQVLNEISLGPGEAIPWRSQENLETLTYVLDGIVLHADNQGQAGVLRTGEFQLMSAGTGMRHEQVNGSRIDRAHFFESRLRPDAHDHDPECTRRRFSAADRKGKLRLIASPDALEASFRLRQNVRVYSSLPDRGCHLIHELKPERRAWLQVIRGRVQLNHLAIVAGDGVAFEDERSVSITALQPSEVLLFDLA
jgi:redox-sensitive bicupin YhaK (pirin superfamily)